MLTAGYVNKHVQNGPEKRVQSCLHTSGGLNNPEKLQNDANDDDGDDDDDDDHDGGGGGLSLIHI